METEVKITISIAISGALLPPGYKYIIKPIIKWLVRLNKAINELFPNGGSSIKDSVQRIEKSIDVVKARAIAVQDLSDCCIFECDIDGLCTFANKKLCELFGLDAAQMMGSGWLEAILPEDRISAFNTWSECVEHNIPYEIRYTIVCQRTGERKRCLATAKPMRRPVSNEVLGYHGQVKVIDNK